MSQESSSDTPNSSSQPWSWMKSISHFGKLIRDNLKHVRDKDYKPNVAPEFEVIARWFDKTQAAIITLLIQAITWRNFLGGKLKEISLGRRGRCNGRTLMATNWSSYVWSIYLLGSLGKDIASLVWQAIEQLSLDPLYATMDSNQLYKLAFWLVLYALSWTITLFQTTNDWTHLYEKYKDKMDPSFEFKKALYTLYASKRNTLP